MFSDRAKLIALAIVHIFETSKALGDYSAVAVLNDGAGISYGINQFTHRSGSLYAVIEAYLAQRPTANVEIITRALPYLKLTTFEAIRQCSINAALKNALAAAGHSPEMQSAQRQVMTERYLKPAIDACEGSHFTLPLSLAVIYDAMNHGSYALIRDRDMITHEQICDQVCVDRSDHGNSESFEKAWIGEYVTLRDQWLASVPRLASTRYRTRLFLNLIKNANWNLDLPIIVQGIKLTDATLGLNSTAAPVVQPTSTGDVSVAIPDKPLVTPKIEQPSTNSPQTVVQQQVPLYVKIGAVFTFLTGLGINAGSLIQQKLTELTPRQLLYCVLALGLCYFAVWWLRHERKAATQLTNKLVDAAADPKQNTVEIQK